MPRVQTCFDSVPYTLVSTAWYLDTYWHLYELSSNQDEAQDEGMSDRRGLQRLMWH